MCEILGRIVSFSLRDTKASVTDKKQDFLGEYDKAHHLFQVTKKMNKKRKNMPSC